MNSLNEIKEWHPLSLQIWLRELEEKDLKKDLILVLPHLSRSINHLILENLSSRSRKMVLSELKQQQKYISSRSIEKAQERILNTANDLIDLGTLNEPKDEDIHHENGSIHISLPEELSTRNVEELIKTLLLLSKYAKLRGLLALEEAIDKINDPFLKRSLGLLMDGPPSHILEEILRNQVQAISYQRDLIYSIIIEGILGIKNGSSSWILENQLKSYLAPEKDKEYEANL